jgi:hypothetical protein
VNGLKVVGVAMAMVAAAAMTACSGSEATAVKPSAPPVPGSTPVLDVAAQLKAPDGHRPVASMDASGVQVYECADGAWKLLEPAATLTENGKTTALHSRGPVWVSTTDGSAVNASPVKGGSVPRPNAVPELLLKATATRGTGVFGQISYIQRLRTEGGTAPGEPCTGKEQKAVPYTATYVFYAPVK